MRMLISKIHKESGLRKYDLKHQRITVSVTVAVTLFEWDDSISGCLVGAVLYAIPSLCKILGFVKLYMIWGQDFILADGT